MSSYLVVLNGPDVGSRIPLTGDKYVLGRHPDCDIVVEVGAVSRYHAQIVKQAGEYVAEDLGSRNGTFINDIQIHAAKVLSSGDSIRVCDITFEFHHDSVVHNSIDAPPNRGASSVSDTVPRQLKEPSAFGTILVDDYGDSSKIMSKLEVSSQAGGTHLSSSPEVKLNALLQITRHLAGTLSLDEVLPKVLDGLFKIFLQADRGFIILLDEKGNPIPRWSKARREGDDEVRISRTIVSHVLRTREVILSADAAADSRFEMSQSITDFKIRSIMCAPLVDAQENAIGVLQIDTVDQRKRFQQEDLEVLASVALQAANSIERAQLHEAAIKQALVERELTAAHQVQIGFLPSTTPQFPGYEFFHYYKAAHTIGGDYYDYIPLSDGRVAVLVGDVVGHGIAASLMMAKLSAEARYGLASIHDPKAAIETLNNNFCRAIPGDKFVTLGIHILDPQTHQIVMLNAGHNPPLLRHVDGRIESLAEEEIGLPIGIMEDADYDIATIELQPGQTILMYTDGINEAMNAAGDQFGMERLYQRMARPFTSIESLGEGIINDCHQFMGTSPPYDDMCMVAYRRQAEA
ncbi:MAG: SpoIIE family protein phosphatase [Pirellulaceae bacterium]